MQNLNAIPIVGKFTDVASTANNNFAAVKLAIDQLELTASRAKGMFSSASALTTKYPSPAVGDWAIVQDSSVSPAVTVVYMCSTAGTWSNTGQSWEGGSVDLDGYALLTDVPECGYYTCNTGASTAAKTVSASGYHLKLGGNVRILMANANTAANPTLNIGSTGAKPLYYDGVRASSTNSWEAGETVVVYYDGTNYYASNAQGGGRFATNEKVNDVPITQNIEPGGNGLPTSGAVYENVPSNKDSSSDSDLDISDENGNVLARFSGGDFKVKNFDSEKNNINLGVDSVEEFSSSRAYLINEIVRRDGLLYKFIEPHEAGEWDSSQVEQTNVMQALAHPVEVEESNNNSDLDISDESGNVLVRFRGGHFQVKNFNSENIETKRHINILFFGNSLTQDAITYTPLLLKEIAPEIEFTLYDWYNAGATLAQQYTYLQNDTACQIFSVYDSKTNSWVNYNNTKNISWVLENCNFDILCLQEYSYYEFTDQQLITNFDNVANYFCENYDKALKIIYLIDAPNRSKVETMMTLAEHYATTCMKKTVCESILPTGNAIYYALQTSLSTLGDVGGLSPDGTHAQEGLPCLLQAYVVAMWIFKELGIAKSVFGSKVRVTTSVYTQLNPPGANLGSGVITGTEAQHLIAQECAIKAFKRGQILIMDSLINNN